MHVYYYSRGEIELLVKLTTLDDLQFCVRPYLFFYILWCSNICDLKFEKMKTFNHDNGLYTYVELFRKNKKTSVSFIHVYFLRSYAHRILTWAFTPFIQSCQKSTIELLWNLGGSKKYEHGDSLCFYLKLRWACVEWSRNLI